MLPSWVLALLSFVENILVKIGWKVLSTPAKQENVDVKEGPISKPPVRRPGLYGLRDRGERE